MPLSPLIITNTNSVILHKVYILRPAGKGQFCCVPFGGKLFCITASNSAEHNTCKVMNNSAHGDMFELAPLLKKRLSVSTDMATERVINRAECTEQHYRTEMSSHCLQAQLLFCISVNGSQRSRTWIGFSWPLDKSQWWDLINTQMHLRVPWKEWDFFISWATLRFSRRALLHGVNSSSVLL